MALEYYFAKALKKMRGRAIRNSEIHFTSKIEPGSEVVNSSFGRHSFCGYRCEINNADIGSFCSIANDVIIGGGAHPLDWVSTSPVFYEGRDSVVKKYSTHRRPEPARTSIGHDVWIGSRALVRQGVKIGVGAVVGMGSVVTHDVAAYSIVAGVPARHVRFRFEPETVEALLNSQWRTRDDESLARAARSIQNPARFLEELRS